MKKLSAGSPHTKFIAAASAFIWTIAIAASAGGAQLQEARVTQIVNDVKLLLEQGAPRPAVVSDLVQRGNAVRTGTQSRSELTFADLTITRLGANTIFSFKEGTREMNLVNGAILFQVPKGSGGATIRTVGVTAAITGTTGIGEFHPATTSHPQPFSKWLCLEGTFTLYLPNGQSVEVGPGRMVTTDGKKFSKVLTFDIAKLMSTSLFFIGFEQPLPPAVLNLIALEEQNQLVGSLVATTTTNPLDPTQIVNVISQAVVAQQAQSSPSSSVTPPPPTPPPPTPPPPTPPPPTPPPPTPPPPTPSKFGTPSVITSPAPYLITSGTVITTDPSITTNGVTDYGKIYRDPVTDGAFSLWAFGSTSAFDTALNIDTQFFADPNHLPIAAFKFQSLSLTGNPTIDTSNGVTKLALIGVNGITSGPPGGILTFTGLDLLALGTVNGSINLTSDISFQNLNDLAMYARGAGSNLILDSPISNIGDLKLGAEGSIQLTNSGTMNVGQFDATAGDDLTLQIGGSLLLNGKVRLKTLVLPGVTVNSGANLTLNTTGDYTNSSTSDFSAFQLTNQGTINQNGNISLGVNGNLNCANGVLMQVNNELDSGVSATQGGTIGGDSSISVSANTVSTEGFFVSLLNENDQGGTGTAGGHIGGAASIAINVNGALTTHANNPNPDVEPGAFDLFIYNYGFGDGSPGGFIGSNASVSIAAASISTAGDFAVGIDNSDGGTIGGAARLSVTAGSMSVDEFFAAIYNGNFTGGTGSVGGHLVGAASITFNITGALNVAGGTDNDGDEPSTMSFQIDNSGFGDGSPAGSIGSDASIDVTAGSISDNGRSLLLGIFNGGGGMIGGNASITVAANSISAAGPGPTGAGENLNLLIDNSAAGNINDNATISLNAGSVSTTRGFNATIGNSSGGTIGGSADVNFNLTGNLTTQRFAVFTIDNSNGGAINSGATVAVSAANMSSMADSLEVSIRNAAGGMIGSNATIDVNAASISAANLFSYIGNNNHGSIVGNAIFGFGVAGDINTQSDAAFYIFNDSNGSGGGTIGLDAMLSLSAVNISTVGDLDAEIRNAGGNIGGSTNLNFNLTGDLTTQGNATFQISNNDYGDGGGPGAIGGDAEINVNAANITANSLLAQINNSNGGTIGGAANVAVNVDNDVTVSGPDGINLLILNGNSGHIGNGANVLYSVGGTTSTTNLNEYIDNSNGGTISNGGNVTLHTVGPVMLDGALVLEVDNFNGGTINNGANVTAHFIGDLTDTAGQFHSLNWYVLNGSGFFNPTATGGTIVTGGDINITFDGNASTTGTSDSGSIAAEIQNGSGGSIGTGGNITMTVGGNLNSGPLFIITENEGGHIGTGGNNTLNVSGDITTQGDAQFQIFNNDNGNGSGPGTMGSNATINVSATNISTGGSLFADIFNYSGGNIGGNALIGFTLSGDIITQGDVELKMESGFAGGMGTIGGNATIDVNAASVNAGGSLSANIFYYNAGNIGGNALIDFTLSGDIITQGDVDLRMDSGFEGGMGTIGGNATIDVNAASVNAGGSLSADILNYNGAEIGESAIINFDLSGNITTQGDADFLILNNATIGADATINVTAASISTGGSLFDTISNTGGNIGGNANLNFNLTGDVTTQGGASFVIDNNNFGLIGSDATINVAASSISVGGGLDADIFSPGGNIGGSALLSVAISGEIATQGDVTFSIFNNDQGSGAGTIGSDATINLTAASISTGGAFNAEIDNSSGGSIGGSANLTLALSGGLTTQGGDATFFIDNANRNASSGGAIGGDASVNVTTGGDINSQGNAIFQISNDDAGSGAGGGTIGTDAAISVTAGNISTGASLFARIFNYGRGEILGNANVNFNLSGDLTTQGDAIFQILNNDNGTGGGTIGSDATVTVNANNISTGGTFDAEIDNFGAGVLGTFGGTIGGNAVIDVTAANITANSLITQIDNTGGSIGANTEGGATINVNVSGTATVTNDATVAIYGSDGAGFADINFNGGSYNVGGTFLSYIDGNGTITFNNVNAHADVLKAGVFGANGALNISGGMLSADSTLKLYAPGSNGQLNFMSNVTLGGNSLKILAANSITISNNVVVTISIGGPIADVYTNHANYTGFGGNGTTTGTFAGAGAHNPQPLSSAPPFGPGSPVKLTIGGNIPIATGVPPQYKPARTPAPSGNIASKTRIPPPSPSNVLTGGKIADARRANNVINVRSSDELLSLLDGGAPGHDGKITIPPSKNASNSKNSNRTDPAGRLNAGSRLNVDRRAMDMRTASSSLMRRSPQ